MPPKVKTTKDDIIKAAVEIVRKSGASALNARDIALQLGCSTQPIFSNFFSMEELRDAVILRGYEMYRQYITEDTSSGEYPPYKASGMAYIRFATEEREMFKLLFMRDRSEERGSSDMDIEDIIAIIKKNVGLDDKMARLFHLEMWVYVHGIATITATGYLSLDRELVSRMLTDSYQGLLKRYTGKEN